MKNLNLAFSAIFGILSLSIVIISIIQKDYPYLIIALMSGILSRGLFKESTKKQIQKSCVDSPCCKKVDESCKNCK